jgi:hypothetical protein
MQAIRDATDLEDAKSAARWVLDLLVGPDGRHAAEFTQAPGVLPADGPEVVDPGLALAVYDTTSAPEVREIIDGLLLGDVDRWRRPSERWSEIDAAVAAWSPSNNPMPGLDGHLMRVVGWAALSLKASSLEQARALGTHGVVHTALSLQAAREALAVAQSLPQQPEAP